MKIEKSKLTKLVITGAPRLDPVHVYAEDVGPGCGTLLVRCFDAAWHCYWGSMGVEKDGSHTTVIQFIRGAGTGYVSNCLVRGNRGVITDDDVQEKEERYVERIVDAIKRALEIQAPRITALRKSRLERLQHVNELIKVIGSHGRRFYFNEKAQRFARIEMDERGKLWWIDDYLATRVCIEKMGGYEHNWRGFSHGGTLKQLAQMMRDYVKSGERIRAGYIGASYWGYDDESAKACREQALALPIIGG